MVVAAPSPPDLTFWGEDKRERARDRQRESERENVWVCWSVRLFWARAFDRAEEQTRRTEWSFLLFCLLGRCIEKKLERMLSVLKINSASKVINNRKNGSVCGSRSGPVGRMTWQDGGGKSQIFEAVKKKSDVFNNRDKSLEFYRPITLSPPSLSADRDKWF